MRLSEFIKEVQSCVKKGIDPHLEFYNAPGMQVEVLSIYEDDDILDIVIIDVGNEK